MFKPLYERNTPGKSHFPPEKYAANNLEGIRIYALFAIWETRFQDGFALPDSFCWRG
jgi:hypothetical protein